MRKSRFSEEQIIGTLREHESGLKTAELCRKYGISDATFYKYNAKFGGITVSDAQRRRALGEAAARTNENSKLKGLLAESMLERAIERHWFKFNGERSAEGYRLIKLMTPDDRPKAVQHMMAVHELSERRAGKLANLDRSTFQYEISGQLV